MNATGIEIIGYVSSGLVLVSFLMASVVKLRVVNTIGSFIFAVYALLIRSYPTALMNVCLVLINLYHLYKLRNSEPNYRLLTLDPKDGFLSYFLDSFREDIAKCFPGRDYPVAGQDRAFLVCHGSESAGLLMGRMVDGTLSTARWRSPWITPRPPIGMLPSAAICWIICPTRGCAGCTTGTPSPTTCPSWRRWAIRSGAASGSWS